MKITRWFSAWWQLWEVEGTSEERCKIPHTEVRSKLHNATVLKLNLLGTPLKQLMSEYRVETNLGKCSYNVGEQWLPLYLSYVYVYQGRFKTKLTTTGNCYLWECRNWLQGSYNAGVLVPHFDRRCYRVNGCWRSFQLYSFMKIFEWNFVYKNISTSEEEIITFRRGKTL